MGKKSGIGSKKVAIDFDPLEALFGLPDSIRLDDLDGLLMDKEIELNQRGKADVASGDTLTSVAHNQKL